MAYVVTECIQLAWCAKWQMTVSGRRTGSCTPERDVVGPEESTGTAGLYTDSKSAKSRSGCCEDCSRTDLPPLTLAIVLLEQTLVVGNAVFAGDEAIA